MSQEEYVRRLMRDAMGYAPLGPSPELDAMATVKKIIESFTNQAVFNKYQLADDVKAIAVPAIQALLKAHGVKRLSGSIDCDVKLSDRQHMRILITNEDLGAPEA